jgi:zinc protease
LLEEGAGDWSADEIADRLDRVGARFSASSRRDSASVSLRSLVDPRYLQPAVETVARLLKEPSLRPGRGGAGAPANADGAPGTRPVARRHRPGCVFQSAVRRSSLRFAARRHHRQPERHHPRRHASFHRRYYTAANAVVAIVGDLDRPAAEQLANALVGGLPKAKPLPPLPPRRPFRPAGRFAFPTPPAKAIS